MGNTKKVGDNLEIKHFVIHQLLKEATIRNVVSKKAKSLIPIGEKEKMFLGNLDKSYHKKSSPIYGIFANEDPTFKDFLLKYIDSTDDFYDFSVNVMDHYKKILEKTIAATGGYLILCEYSNKTTGKDLLLVLMINNKEGYVVNEKDLTLENIKNLDLSRVDVACLINLTDWKNIEDEDTSSDRQTYLSFVKGMKQVSYYFMTFIDVDNKKTTTESTNRLIIAFDDYSEQKAWDRDTKIKMRNSVFDYCRECIATKKEILLKRISTIIDPENFEDFEDFATEEKYRVSSIISGDKSKMKILRYISYKDDELKLEFDSSLLMNKTIYLDEKTNKLTIKNIPKELVDKIKSYD